ncbi:MAG: hypothetical protein ACJATA_002155 [Sphingobacteriales bacterium]|jgi:uncharacterized protein YndB with AHSA1/START domain
MKVLKYILAGLVLIVLLLVILGLVKKELKYSTTVTIEKPIEHVWDVLMDHELAPEWLKGITKYEIVSGEMGAEGSVYMVYFNEDGEEIVMEETALEIVKNERYKFALTNPVMSSTIEINLVSIDENTTELTSSTVAKGAHVVWNAVFYIMKSNFVGRDKLTYGFLKTLVEKTPEKVEEPAEEILDEETIME